MDNLFLDTGDVVESLPPTPPCLPKLATPLLVEGLDRQFGISAMILGQTFSLLCVCVCGGPISQSDTFQIGDCP